MAVYRQGLLQIGTVVVPVENVNVSPAVEVSARMSAGDYYPTAQTVFGAIPSITATLPLDVALTQIGLQLKPFTAFKAQVLKVDAATGILAAGSVHTVWASVSAANIVFGCIQSIQASQSGLATAECAFWAAAAAPSTTHPLARTDNNAALALAAQPTLHTLGTVTLNNAAIAGADSVSLAMNHNIIPRQSDGDLYPSQVTWHGASPVISVAHGDPQAVTAAITLYGAAIGSATSIAFRQRTAGIITTTSKTITVAAGHIVPDDISGGVGGAATHGFRILVTSTNGITDPLGVS
jgi:hypothetical protein